MNKIQGFTDAERAKYGKLYADFIMHGEEIAALHGDKVADQRFYRRKAPVLKTYLDALDEADYKANGQGVMEMFKSDNQYKEEALAVKRKAEHDIEKLVKCSTCACAKCLQVCPFNACSYCQFTAKITACDKERYCITTGHKPVSLYSNDEEREVYFEVQGMLTDNFSNKRYTYLVETANRDNQHILEYNKYVNGEVEYLPIDEELLDKVYNVFVELGCHA